MSYAVLDRKTREIKRGYTRQQASEELLSEHWTMHRYVGIGETEDGRYSVGGEQHFVNADGDWDCEDFRWFEADTLDDVLDHVLAPEMGRAVFDEDDLTTELHLAALEQERLNKEALRQIESDMAASLRRLEAGLKATFEAEAAKAPEAEEQVLDASQIEAEFTIPVIEPEEPQLESGMTPAAPEIGAYAVLAYETYIIEDQDGPTAFDCQFVVSLHPTPEAAREAAAGIGPATSHEAFEAQIPATFTNSNPDQPEHYTGPYTWAVVTPLTQAYAAEIAPYDFEQQIFDFACDTLQIDGQTVACTEQEWEAAGLSRDVLPQQAELSTPEQALANLEANREVFGNLYLAAGDDKATERLYDNVQYCLDPTLHQEGDEGLGLGPEHMMFTAAEVQRELQDVGIVPIQAERVKLELPSAHLATGDMVSEQQEANDVFDAHNRELAERQRDSERQETLRETGHDAPAEKSAEAALETSATAERDVRAEINALYREHFPDSGKDSGQSQERSGPSIDFSR